jgi:hypothetical protein
MSLDLAREGTQRIRCMVGDPCPQGRGGAILNHDRNLLGLAQRKRFGHRSAGSEPAAARQQRKVARRQDQETRVEDDGHQSKHGRNNRQRDQGGSNPDRPQQPGLRRDPAKKF